MEEEVASLRVALEHLQARQDQAVRTNQQRWTRQEHEWAHQINQQQQQIEQLQRQVQYQDDIRQENDDLHIRLDRVLAEQSLLWDTVGRITTSSTRDHDHKAKAATSSSVATVVARHNIPPPTPTTTAAVAVVSPESPYYSSTYINKKQLNYETERLMQIWKTQMADMASCYNTNFDDVRDLLNQLRTETRHHVDATVKKNHLLTKRQYENLVGQVNDHTRSIAEVQEDQEVSNMALIDTMSCMKTKFDAVLEELQLYGSLPNNSMISTTNQQGGNEAASSGSGESGECGSRITVTCGKPLDNNNNNDPVVQIFERKSGQWNAQFKKLRSELRSFQREQCEQRQDVAELQQLLETSVNVLSQQAETTASLCEKQLQRLYDQVRRETTAQQTDLRTVQTDLVDMGQQWRDRFNELLHVLDSQNRYGSTTSSRGREDNARDAAAVAVSGGGDPQQQQQRDPASPLLTTSPTTGSSSQPARHADTATSPESIETTTTVKKTEPVVVVVDDAAAVDSSNGDDNCHDDDDVAAATTTYDHYDIIDLTGKMEDRRDDFESDTTEPMRAAAVVV
jgi:hypothetical protein